MGENDMDVDNDAKKDVGLVVLRATSLVRTRARPMLGNIVSGYKGNDEMRVQACTIMFLTYYSD